MTSVGNLNCLIALMRQASGQDEIGQPNGVWSAAARLWANIRYGTGAEAIRSDALTSIAKASIRIRKRADVTSADRIVYGSTTFEILAVLPDEGSRMWTDLVCQVVQ
jgi:SPP1 family predicted phage head-tail adaptor